MAGKRVTIDKEDHVTAEPSRWSVMFQLFPPGDRSGRRYFVCTLFGEHKALAIAVGVHEREHPGEQIYRVIEVRSVGAGGPERNDLVDRMEW